jgi:hypothetical protein
VRERERKREREKERKKERRKKERKKESQSLKFEVKYVCLTNGYYPHMEQQFNKPPSLSLSKPHTERGN